MKEKKEEKQEPVKEAQPLKEEELDQVNGGAGEGKKYVCKKCGATFGSPLDLRTHERDVCFPRDLK